MVPEEGSGGRGGVLLVLAGELGRGSASAGGTARLNVSSVQVICATTFVVVSAVSLLSPAFGATALDASVFGR